MTQKEPVCLIFDFDGTLHETMKIYGPAFRKNYERLSAAGLLPPRSFRDEEIAYWLGFNAAEMWNTFAPDLASEEKERSSREIQDEMQRLIADGTASLYPGVEEMLDTLKAEGYTLLFLSNCKTRYLEAHRKAFPLSRWFEDFYWAEAAGWIPKGEIMKQIFREHPGRFLAIGDRFLDMEAARENGIPSIACGYGYGSPEEYVSAAAVVERPADLVEAVRRIARLEER